MKEFKDSLAEIVAKTLFPIHLKVSKKFITKAEEYLEDKESLNIILKNGADKAAYEASINLKEIKYLMGMHY
jgi:hypothetical protein